MLTRRRLSKRKITYKESVKWKINQNTEMENENEINIANGNEIQEIRKEQKKWKYKA